MLKMLRFCIRPFIISASIGLMLQVGIHLATGYGILAIILGAVVFIALFAALMQRVFA